MIWTTIIMIVHSSGMATKRNPLGATGETVRANVIARRERDNLSYAQLSRKLKAVGRVIPELGLRRIEEGDRRIDVDDLMALAAAFEVSPTTLLMPSTDDGDQSATTTVGTVTASRLWKWLTGEMPLAGDTTSDGFGFILRSVPSWLVGTEIDLIQTGLSPNQKYSIRRREHTQELEKDTDGNH